MIGQLILQNLDLPSRRAWELHSSKDAVFSLEELLKFLEDKVHALESIQIGLGMGQNKHEEKGVALKSHRGVTRSFLALGKASNGCNMCKGNHALYRCQAFLDLNTQQRSSKVRQLLLCFNCLHSGHSAYNCKVSHHCKRCGKQHHTLLHIEKTSNPKVHQNENKHLKEDNLSKSPVEGEFNKEQPVTTTSGTYCALKLNTSHVILATALVQVKGYSGHLHQCRVLLDSGSQTNFVSEAFLNRLKVERHNNTIPIQGISNLQSETKYCATLTLYSMHSSYMRSISCAVLKNITGDTPTSVIDVSDWPELEHVNLADPSFYKPGSVDLLIGAEVFFELLKPTPQIQKPGFPTLIDTELGWILSGELKLKTQNRGNKFQRNFFVRCDDLQGQLQRFWALEEITTRVLTKEEEQAETHFKQHTIRDKGGRYSVSLPLKKATSALGDSYEGALRRLVQLERRFLKNEKLRQDYTSFMNEYEALGHMKQIDIDSIKAPVTYYLPHHPVIKEQSTTTKTRVVFDASYKTTSNVSLNEILLVGPTIQEDLCAIIMRFRTHKVCFTADIEKMYRQVLVHDADTPLQRILWRKNPDEPIKEFELKTVTYGTASAPFLATRCLQQLAIDEGKGYPDAAKILLQDMYVDDCISGADNITTALGCQNQLITLCSQAGFHLRKWSSNYPELLQAIPEHDRETQFPLRLDVCESVKTLGLLWHPATDQFSISYDESGKFSKVSKRSVLSSIASIFDPLGLISPVVILCKIFMQKLWQAQLEWDEPLPSELECQWRQMHTELSEIKHFKINRYVLSQGQHTNVQLHGFADASERAFGACVYIRTEDLEGEISSKLLCAKSRVAPLKKLTVPRLELCAAVLLARLCNKVIKTLRLELNAIILWSDSTTVLAWLASSPARWKTFIANRVAEIQRLTEGALWLHISTGENPADLVSRGVSPRLLINNNLWWQGPQCLQLTSFSSNANNKIDDADEVICEEKTVSLLASRVSEWEVLGKFSKFSTLQRVLAYCVRFGAICRTKKRNDQPLSSDELRHSTLIIVKHIQQHHFLEELSALNSNSPLPTGSTIMDLHPFIDDQGLLRVGGRLQHSLLPYEAKFQLIIPHSHYVTKLIIMAEHIRLLHAGQTLLISALRQRYWITKIKATVRSTIRKCTTCFKMRAEAAQQLMGTLPRPRVQPSRPFLNSGVDYAGPLSLRIGGKRSKTVARAYISIFICLATKAIHLEVVSELTADAFIAALRRFFSRRGRCQNLYSDNVTNFIGANKKLVKQFFNLQTTQRKIFEFTAQEEVTWHFIPPSSPHFGGLWEAGVRSMKYHLRRATGTAVFSFEELLTLVCQIEACLNSRPLLPLSNDPQDPSLTLTPGHFLTGSNLMSIPDPDYADTSVNRLTRWQKVQKMLQYLWSRWSTDYLHTLQQRSKWRSASDNLKLGELVLVKESSPPLQWKVGVIEQLHPGDDGLVRVVTIRTPSGLMKRPITKLCPFPDETSSG